MFGAAHLTPSEVRGKRVIEVGSYDMNGSLRPIVSAWSPAEYVGVDITPGPGVDMIVGADDILAKFGRERFDIVLTTEMVEHVRNWRTVFSNLKNITAPNGIIILTTRSPGFFYHPHPEDFWRYTADDMRTIFSDCRIEALESDDYYPGIFVRAVNPADFKETDLSHFNLTSIITGTRILDIDEKTLADFKVRFERRRKLRKKLAALEQFFVSLGRRIIPKV